MLVNKELDEANKKVEKEMCLLIGSSTNIKYIVSQKLIRKKKVAELIQSTFDGIKFFLNGTN